MAKTAMLSGILERIGFPVAKHTNTWSVISVEKMLDELGISRYEFDYEPKVVRLANEDDLMVILRHVMPSGISNDSGLTITQSNEVAKLRIGSWQFETKA